MKQHSTNPRAQREARQQHAKLARTEKREHRLEKEHTMKAYLIAPETRTQLLDLLERLINDELADGRQREAAVNIRPHLLVAPERFVADTSARERLGHGIGERRWPGEA